MPCPVADDVHQNYHMAIKTHDHYSCGGEYEADAAFGHDDGCC